MTRQLCLVFGLLAAGSLAAADAPSLPAGRAALEAGNLRQALLLFRSAQREAVVSRDRAALSDAAFYEGLTLQRQAAGPATDVGSARLRTRAIAAYRRALLSRPGSASAANNLALALRAEGQDAEALTVLEAAAGPSPPAYLALNLGALRGQAGDWKGEAAAYALALRAEPHNDRAEASLFELRRAHDPAAVPAHLWDLVRANRVSLAQKRALDLLREGTGSPETRAELLAVVALTCSKQVYDPARWLEGDTAAALRALGQDPGIGAGARQLVALHEWKAPVDRDAFAWWSRSYGGREPERGVWPVDAFHALVRALAGWYRGNGVPKQAEDLYLLSNQLNPMEPDPTALLEVADMMAVGGRLEELNRLMEREEPQLFAAKGAAYRASQLATIYSYHRALGVIYTYLGHYTGGVASSEFQLSRAIEVAHDYNRHGAREPLRVEPRLYNLLAVTYEKLNRPAQAADVRIAAVEESLDRKDMAAAFEISAPVEASAAALTPDTRARWDRVSQRLGVAAAAAVDPHPAGFSALTIDDVSLKGLVRNGSEYVALVGTADGKSYFLKPGARLANGEVARIDAKGLTVRQAGVVPKDIRVEYRPRHQLIGAPPE